MKLTTTVIGAAALILFIVFLELFVGIKWALNSYSLADADLKPIRPAARFIFTGVIASFTLFFGAALIRSVGWKE